ncbi:MAG TPA: hypothetical protein VHU41_19650 [Thermoanaerobaculia bacterium]|nr:hypothetical protein [Thermoanaerobaculia bacterium]
MRSYSWIPVVALLAAPALFADVTGQFTTDKRPPIKPKYAAAFETRDQRDARKRAIEVVLSEEPVDMAAAIGALDPHTILINQKGLQDHNYILLWVRPGNDVSMNATYGATMTQFADFTGGRFNADIKTLTADTVAGHVWMSSAAKTMSGGTYSIDVAFSAPITHGPAATKLAAGGGEPGKALQSLLGAMSKKDWNAIQSGVTEDRRKSFDDLDDALSSLGIWLSKKPGKITGGELRGDTAILEMEGQIFEGQKALYLVKMVKSGPRWVFEAATPAGMID